MRSGRGRGRVGQVESRHHRHRRRERDWKNSRRVLGRVSCRTVGRRNDRDSLAEGHRHRDQVRSAGPGFRSRRGRDRLEGRLESGPDLVVRARRRARGPRRCGVQADAACRREGAVHDRERRPRARRHDHGDRDRRVDDPRDLPRALAGDTHARRRQAVRPADAHPECRDRAHRDPHRRAGGAQDDHDRVRGRDDGDRRRLAAALDRRGRRGPRRRVRRPRR